MSSDLNSTSTSEEVDAHPLKKAVAPLSNGFMKIYGPDLKSIQKVLKELNEKEEILLKEIHEENLNTSEIQHSKELIEMFNNIEIYKNKLINIKKDMKHLHEKSVKLKKRALRIQQIKEKAIYIKQQKEAEIKMEQDLIAKPTTSFPV